MEELASQTDGWLKAGNRAALIAVDNEDHIWRFVHAPVEGKIILGVDHQQYAPGDTYFLGHLTLPWHEGEVPMYFTVIKPATIAELTALAGQVLSPRRRFLYEVTND